MLLTTLLTRNPTLTHTATTLHHQALIPPDTYVLDLDAVEANAALLAAEADRFGLGLWFVVKQIGRNPEVVRAIARHIGAYAAIDAPEARLLQAAGARAGNVGHLVQIPPRALPEVLAWRPEAVTVYDVANLRAVAAAAERLGRVQDVLMRVEGAAGAVHPGQEGGVPPSRAAEFARSAEGLAGVRIAGVTAFPCLECDPVTGELRPTENLKRAVAAREELHGTGLRDLRLSAPGVTCAAAFPLLAAAGATHGEPGHALTGSTPLHAVDPGQPETPAYVYVTEVAHTLADGRPALAGGGFYPRGRVGSAFLPRSGVRLRVAQAPAENIDYYRLLEAPADPSAARLGDTAVLAFRTQIFVTRSTVAVVRGLSSGAPRLTGLYDALGRPLR